MSFDDVLLLLLYAAAFVFVGYHFFTKYYGGTEELTDDDKEFIEKFVKKVQREYDFHWRIFNENHTNYLEAYICGKTGYVLAKIEKHEPFYSAYFSGKQLGDYVTHVDAKEAIMSHINAPVLKVGVK